MNHLPHGLSIHTDRKGALLPTPGDYHFHHPLHGLSTKGYSLPVRQADRIRDYDPPLCFQALPVHPRLQWHQQVFPAHQQELPFPAPFYTLHSFLLHLCLTLQLLHALHIGCEAGFAACPLLFCNLCCDHVVILHLL